MEHVRAAEARPVQATTGGKARIKQRFDLVERFPDPPASHAVLGVPNDRTQNHKVMKLIGVMNMVADEFHADDRLPVHTRGASVLIRLWIPTFISGLFKDDVESNDP